MGVPSTRLRLRVTPGAARSEIVGRHGDAWRVRVAAVADRGRANEALVRLLARRLELRRSDITLVSGHAGRDKVVQLSGLGSDEVERRLEGASA
jgi:hypothetical protein